MTSTRQFPTEQLAVETRRFLLRVHGWMSAGLLVTAATASGVSSSLAMKSLLLGNSWLFMALLFVELLMVWTFSSRARNVSSIITASIFISYVLLNGITCSIASLIYTEAQISLSFRVAVTRCAGMSAYGALVRRRLGRLLGGLSLHESPRRRPDKCCRSILSQ